jgi:hypothetical protein
LLNKRIKTLKESEIEIKTFWVVFSFRNLKSQNPDYKAIRDFNKPHAVLLSDLFITNNNFVFFLKKNETTLLLLKFQPSNHHWNYRTKQVVQYSTSFFIAVNHGNYNERKSIHHPSSIIHHHFFILFL